MNPEKITDLYNNFSPWLAAKVFILLFLIFYIFFALIVNRQASLMNHILEAKFSPIVKLLSIIHLLAIISIFIIALLFL